MSAPVPFVFHPPSQPVQSAIPDTYHGGLMADSPNAGSVPRVGTGPSPHAPNGVAPSFAWGQPRTISP